MRIIGITGGIGSGKSTVSQILSGFGAKIVDADVIAREIVQKGESALKEIKEYFGQDIIDSDGELDRKKLGQLVFSDPDKLSVLNTITHKYIIEKIKKYVAEAKKNGTETLVVDAAIPFKSGFIDVADEIWAVLADEKVRVDRIVKRNNITSEEAQKRIDSQMKQEEYEKLADHILYNNGGMEELTYKVKSLFFH